MLLKRIRLLRSLALAMLASIGACLHETCAADDSGTFRAACVKIDITPDRAQWLHGYAPRQSTGVRDRIFHRIAAFSQGDDQFYIISTDVCTISPAYYDNFCLRAAAELGIDPNEIWWSTTHTHSAPHLGPQDLGQLFGSTLGDRFSIQHDTKYWEWVNDQLQEGLRDAQSKLEPARLGIGIGTASANVNRRERNAEGNIVLGVNPDGPADRQLGVLRLERLDGSIIGLIANYAIHGTTFGGNNQQISSDVMGIASQYVEQSLGVPTLFINGAEGNIAPLYSVGNELNSPLLERYTTLLGEPIVETNSHIAHTFTDVQLSVSKTFIETPRRHGLGWLNELEAYRAVQSDGTELVKLPIYTLVLNNDTVIWAAPVEMYSEIAIRIREDSPFTNTLYFGLTNGSLLYLPTAQAFSEGGYEPNVSVVTSAAESAVITGVAAHLKSLKQSHSTN